MKKLALLIFVGFITSCVGVNPNSLTTPTEQKVISLENDHEFLILSRSGEIIWRNTIRKGQYLSFKNDKKGTYFIGGKNCLIQKNEFSELKVFSSGGIWIPNDRSENPRLFAIVGSNNSGESVSESGSSINDVVNNINPAPYTPQGAVGGAIAGAIISAGIKAESGRYDMFPKFEAPELFELIYSSLE